MKKLKEYKDIEDLHMALVNKLVVEYRDFTKNTKAGWTDYTLMMFLRSVNEIPDNESLLLFIEKVS